MLNVEWLLNSQHIYESRKMGKVLSLMSKPLRNFNVESRAHKIISQDKPVPAPKHKSDQRAYDALTQVDSKAFTEGQLKHAQLDKYLRDVYVKSHDPEVQQPIRSDPNRPLPLDRGQVEDFEYGFKEPEKIPLGKTTLKNALQFITDHHNNSKLFSAKKIAEENKIPEDTITNILKHYRVYEVYIPEQRKVKAKFAGPSIPRIKTAVQPIKQLSAAKEKKDDT